MLLLVWIGAVPAAADAPLRLTLVHVNDWDQMTGVRDAGGAARIATIVAEERNRAGAKRTIVTFGGDMISPSVMSWIDQGAHMIDLANAIGFDLAVVGNHEFDFGPDVLRKRLAESKAVWLAGNVVFKDRSLLAGTVANVIIRQNGYRIGFLGLVTPETAVISSPGPDVSFRSVIEAGEQMARKLKSEGADIVVALTHQGLEADQDLLRRIQEIDIVLGGHDHQLVAWQNRGKVVMKAGSQGRHVGVLALTIERIKGPRGRSRVVWTPDFHLRSTRGVAGDPMLAAKVSAYQRRLDEALDVEIGQTMTEIDTRRFRSGETAFGNLLADAMRAAADTDIALINSGGIRGDTVYPPGTLLTRKMLLTALPYSDRTVVLRLTGAQILQALENGVSRVERSSGRFPQVSGLAFSFDARRPVGERVTRVVVGGKPIDEGRSYTVATNSFLAGGGDGYTVFRTGERLIDAVSAVLTAGQLIDHVATAGTVSPVIEGRITRLD